MFKTVLAIVALALVAGYLLGGFNLTLPAVPGQENATIQSSGPLETVDTKRLEFGLPFSFSFGLSDQMALDRANARRLDAETNEYFVPLWQAQAANAPAVADAQAEALVAAEELKQAQAETDAAVYQRRQWQMLRIEVNRALAVNAMFWAVAFMVVGLAIYAMGFGLDRIALAIQTALVRRMAWWPWSVHVDGSTSIVQSADRARRGEQPVYIHRQLAVPQTTPASSGVTADAEIVVASAMQQHARDNRAAATLLGVFVAWVNRRRAARRTVTIHQRGRPEGDLK